MARFILDINEEERWQTTCILVEHDMGVVMDISHRVMALNFGEKICGRDSLSRFRKIPM